MIKKCVCCKKGLPKDLNWNKFNNLFQLCNNCWHCRGPRDVRDERGIRYNLPIFCDNILDNIMEVIINKNDF